MSPNDYNERFYQLVRRESFYAKRLSAMNEEICEAFLNISRFLIDEGYVSNNAREVDNIVEALPEQALANMFDDDTFATKFKIALKAVNPRLNENALSGEKRQAAAIALRLLEYSKNNATYLRPGCKAPEKDADGPAGEYNPRGRKKRPAGGSGATDASLKGDVTQTTEETEVEEGYKAIDKKKEAAMYRRAGNLARTSLSSKGKKKEEAQTKSARIVSAISSQKERERFAKMGDEKARDNYKEEVEQVDENRRAARAAGGSKDDSKKQPDPSKDGFTGIGNMSIDQIRKMSARIEKEKTRKEEVEEVHEARSVAALKDRYLSDPKTRARRRAKSISKVRKGREALATKTAQVLSDPKSTRSDREKAVLSAADKGVRKDHFKGGAKLYAGYEPEGEQLDEISSHLALTASQKADEERRKASLAGDKERASKKAQQASRLYKGVGPRKAKERMKEEVEIHEEEGKKDACYKKVKARYDVWPSAYASGALVKCRKKGAANWGNKSEAFDIDALLNDSIFDQITEEELLDLAFDIFEEMEQEGILTESLEYFDDMYLTEADAGAMAKGRLERRRMGATADGPAAGSREYKKRKVMGALKTAAKATKEAGSAAGGRAAEAAKRTAGAVKKGAGTAAKAVGAAARGGASLAKKAATKTAAAAGEVAGAAKGGFEAGRIKAKREAMAKTKPQAKSSGDGDKTGGKLDSLLKDVRSGESKPSGSSSGGSSSSSSSSSGSSSGGGSSDSGTQTRKRGLLRRVGSAIKKGLKKAIGKTARGVSNVSGGLATRFGEDTEFDVVLDYLLEYDVCSLDEAEEVMMELTEEEIENILTEREMTAADKKKEAALKKKYDDSGMKASMKKQYGKEEGKKIYFATIRKQAMDK